MSLATETLVISLQVGTWTGQRLDRDASEDLTAQKNADTDAARVNKHLIPKELLAPIKAAEINLRRHLTRVTSPWKDNGERLLSRKLWHRFIDEHDQLRTVFQKAVDKFIDQDYPGVKDQAEFRMGAMHKPEDYPPAETLRRRFYVTLEIDAVTEASDWRCQIEGAAAERLKAEVKAASERRIRVAMQDTWKRLMDQLEGLHTRLTAEGKGSLREAYVTTMMSVVEMLPDMNILNDPALNAMVDRVKAMLQGVSIEDMRHDPLVKQSISAEAQEIMDNMKGFMSAFGGD